MASFADLPLGAKYRIVSAKSRGQVYTKVKHRDHAAHADVFYAYADDLHQIFAAPAASAVVERCQEMESAAPDSVPAETKVGLGNK